MLKLGRERLVPEKRHNIATSRHQSPKSTSLHDAMASSVDIYGGGVNEKLSPSGFADHDNSGDPASSSFFSSDTKKNGDLRAMLEGNKDGLKLEAMKRLIGMIARGNDCADLFPSVVKNVVCKNLEVKKLVYVYLVRYAEEQQDLALLSISTFQKALKDPNQLIRASALRVLSSIRVSMIVPIMMLSIREAMMDMSPYVRKTAALAIPKLYSLDPLQKEELVTIIQKLLGDRTTLVIGSAIMAFEEVCPEKLDLLHKHYRKLCQVLVDVDEWGQVIIIQTLMRYARTQFINPNIRQPVAGEEKPSGEPDAAAEPKPAKKPGDDDEKSDADSDDEPAFFSLNYIDRHLDPDHRMLLRNCRPLLQSRNSAVVMAVIQLYFYVAPEEELVLVTKPLIRMLRSHPEIQSVVLANIKTLSASKTGRKLFEPHLRCFFVRATDPTPIKLIKLRIITNLASKVTISLILREFQNYIASCDAALVAHTIQAIGYCASTINEVSDLCLNGLVNLLSNHDENVVAESIVVIRKLLQMKPEEHKDVIRHMAKLYDRISIPSARASILWLIGEYCEFIPKIAPDVLRKAAQTFVKEDIMVKQQVVNLAVKLYLTNPQQTSLLMQYVITLARYDQNYDLRDRVRLIRALMLPSKQQKANNEIDAGTGAGDNAGLSESNGKTLLNDAGDAATNVAADSLMNISPAAVAAVFAPYLKRIFLTSKPAPFVEKRFRDAAYDDFRLGTLSHCMHSRAPGYEELPDFPLVAPDTNVRHVEVPPNVSTSRAGSSSLQGGKVGAAARNAAAGATKKGSDDEENFWTESDEEEEDDEGEEKKKTDETTDSDDEDEEDEEEEDSGEESDDEEEEEDEDEDEEEDEDEADGDDESGSATGDELTEPDKPTNDRNKIRHQNRHGPPSLAHQQAMADAAAQDIAEKMRPRTSSLSLKNVAGSLQAESDSSGDEASAELTDETNNNSAAARLNTSGTPDSDFAATNVAVLPAARNTTLDTSSTDETGVPVQTTSKQQNSNAQLSPSVEKKSTNEGDSHRDVVDIPSTTNP